MTHPEVLSEDEAFKKSVQDRLHRLEDEVGALRANQECLIYGDRGRLRAAARLQALEATVKTLTRGPDQ